MQDSGVDSSLLVPKQLSRSMPVPPKTAYITITKPHVPELCPTVAVWLSLGKKTNMVRFGKKISVWVTITTLLVSFPLQRYLCYHTNYATLCT